MDDSPINSPEFTEHFDRWFAKRPKLELTEKDLAEFEYWEYINELEREWKRSEIPYTAHDTVRVYGADKDFLDAVITEWQSSLLNTHAEGKERSRQTANKVERMIIQAMYAYRESEINKHIARLMMEYKWATYSFSGTELLMAKAMEFPLQQLVEETTELRHSGYLLMGHCPLHNERTASFYIYPSNTFHCFGCDKSGNPIHFIRERDGLGFREAVEFLAKT